MFTENGKLDREIETRCQKANAVSYQLAPLLKHPRISTSTKAKLINAIFLPTLTYQCQTWSLTKELVRKLVTCEMKCLRKAVNKTRRDKIRNEVIRDMAGAKPVLQHIRQQQVKWFGHTTRMPINQPNLRAYNTKYSGWRARGRPRKRWSDSVADTLRTQGMSLLQATHLAADRQLCPPATPIGTSGRKKSKSKVRKKSCRITPCKQTVENCKLGQTKGDCSGRERANSDAPPTCVAQHAIRMCIGRGALLWGAALGVAAVRSWLSPSRVAPTSTVTPLGPPVLSVCLLVA